MRGISIQYKTDEQGNYKDTVPKFTAAGDYTVYYKVTAPNCKDEVGSFAVKGNKATPVLENVKDAASYTYDNAVETLIEEKKVHDAVVKRNVYSDATVEYSLTGSEFGNFPNVRNANSYTITVKVSGDNYETATATYTLTVGKAAVTAPVIAHKTYNKGAQTATVDAAGALYTVQKNEGGTDAGEYDVVLALNDPSNYKWAGKSGDEESATLTLKFVIDKATLDMGGVKWDYTAEEKSFTYDKTAHTVALTGLPADGDIEVAYQNAQGTAAGEYRAVATLTYDNANYNEITTEWKLTWNIAKADYTVSGVKDDTGYTYNGAAQGRTLDELKRLVTALEGDEFEVSFVGAGQFTAAGEHAVKYTVTGNDNYNDIEDGAYTVKIGKAKAGIDASDITFGDLKGEGASYSATYRGTPYSVEWSKAKPTDDFNGTLTADLIHITGASSFTNYQEGGYTVTLTIDGTNNYDGASLTYKITIDKAEYIVTEPEAKEFTYNGTAQGDPVQVEVKGSDQFTLRYGDGGYQFINANEAGYTVTYTVSGNDNYNDKSGTYTLTINKAEYVVTEPKVKEFTYNGTEQGGVVTAAGVHEGDVIGEITYGGGYQFTDAGEHEVTYSVSGNDNYNEKTGTYTVNIGKAEAQLDVKDITTAYTFTAKEQTVNLDAAQAKSNIEGATGYGAITFEKDGALITEFKFTNVAEGNGVTITVKLSDGRNFIGAETTVALTVAKANYTVSAPAQNFDYDATEHGNAIAVSGLAEDSALQAGDYTVTYNGEETVAQYKNYQDGGYPVQYAVSESANYNAANGSYKIVINKAKPTLENVTDTAVYTYDKDTETQVTEETVRNAVVKDNVYSDATVEYSLTGSEFGSFPTIKNANSYTITVKVSGANYEETTATYTLTVAKKSVTVTLPVNIDTTYDGNEHGGEGVKFDVHDEFSNVVYSISYSVDSGITEEAPKFKNVGLYSVTVKVTPTENYTFEGKDGNFEDTYTVTINKAKAEINTSDIDFGDFEKDGDYTYSATYKGAAYTVDWTVAKPADDFNGTLTTNIVVTGASSFTDANTYTVTLSLAGNANYDTADDVKFTITINKAKAVIDASQITFGDFVKGDNDYSYSATYRGTPYTVDWSKATSNFGSVTNDATEIKNADTYVVTLSVAGTDNYEGDTKEFTITIKRKQLTKPAEDTDSFTYNKNAQTYTLSGFDDASMKIEGASLTQTNAGDYQFTVILSDKTNYEWVGGTQDDLVFTFHIAKATLEKLPEGVSKPTIGEQVNWYGKTLNDIGLGEDWYWETSDSELTLGEETYNIFYNSDRANYEDYVTTIKFTTVRTQLKLQFSKERQTNGIEVEYTDWAAKTAEEFAGSYTLVGTNRGNADIKTLAEEMEYFYYLWKGGPFSLNTPFQDGKIYGGTYLLLYRFFLEEDNPYYEWATDQDPTELDSALMLKIKSVEYAGTLYTIEDALHTATGGTITVKYNTAFAYPEVREEFGVYGDESYYTVKSGVTLKLPYDGTNTYGSPGADSSGTSALSFGDSSKQQLLVSVPANVTVINRGKIEVGGYVTGSGAGNLAGQTYDKYARIDLGENARIESYGDIDVYGFITESTWNNGSEVIMHSGSMKMPFVVVEHRGGSAFSNFKDDLSGAPFNRFFLHNVSAQLTFESASNLYGDAKLKTDKKSFIPAQENQTNIHLIGTDTKALIQLEARSKVVAKLQAEAFEKAYAQSPIKLEVYGDMTLHALSLKVTVTIITVDVTTKGVLFPLSWYWQVTLNPLTKGGTATVNATDQDFKLLPGAKLTIEKGVTLQAQKVAVYKANSWTDAGVGTSNKYETNKGDGILTVNGTLTVNEFGGEVQSGANDAILQVNSKSTILSKEVKSSTGNALEGGSLTWDEINLSLGFTSGTADGVGTYVCTNGTWAKTEKTQQSFTYTVKYHYNDDSDTTEEKKGTILYVNTPAWEITNLDYALIRDFYRFTGWYMESACETPFESWTAKPDAVLDVYAGWEKIEYVINYHFSGAGSELVNPNTSAWSFGEDVALQPATSRGKNGDLTFGGWFFDAGYTQPASVINTETIGEHGYENRFGEHIIDVYAYFSDLNQEYEISYDLALELGYEDISFAAPTGFKIKIGQTLTAEMLPTDAALTKYDTDFTKQYYFDGWLANGKKVQGGTAISGADIVDGKLVLTANWAEKVKLNITLQAKGSSGFFGSAKTASCTVKIDGTQVATPSVKSEKGGSLQTEILNYYLKPGQSYEITKGEGTLSGATSGTAEADKDITVTVTNT